MVTKRWFSYTFTKHLVNWETKTRSQLEDQRVSYSPWSVTGRVVTCIQRFVVSK